MSVMRAINQRRAKAMLGSVDKKRLMACASSGGVSPRVFHNKAWLHSDRVILK